MEGDKDIDLKSIQGPEPSGTTVWEQGTTRVVLLACFGASGEYGRVKQNWRGEDWENKGNNAKVSWLNISGLVLMQETERPLHSCGAFLTSVLFHIRVFCSIRI